MWLCISEGFPGLPFVVDQDISRRDGIIQCKQLTAAEALQYGWRVARAIKIVVDFLKVPPF